MWFLNVISSHPFSCIGVRVCDQTSCRWTIITFHQIDNFHLIRSCRCRCRCYTIDRIRWWWCCCCRIFIGWLFCRNKWKYRLMFQIELILKFKFKTRKWWQKKTFIISLPYRFCSKQLINIQTYSIDFLYAWNFNLKSNSILCSLFCFDCGNAFMDHHNLNVADTFNQFETKQTDKLNRTAFIFSHFRSFYSSFRFTCQLTISELCNSWRTNTHTHLYKHRIRSSISSGTSFRSNQYAWTFKNITNQNKNETRMITLQNKIKTNR